MPIYTEVQKPIYGKEYYYYDGSDYKNGILESTQDRQGMQYSTTVNTIDGNIVDKVYSIRHVRPQLNYGELYGNNTPTTPTTTPTPTTPTPTTPTPHPLGGRRNSFGGGKRKSRHNRKINKTKKSYKKSTKSKKNKKSTRKRKTNKKRKSRRTYRRK